jgi:hypothetical protein
MIYSFGVQKEEIEKRRRRRTYQSQIEIFLHMILIEHGIKKVKYIKNSQQDKNESATTPLNISNADASFSSSASFFLNATAMTSNK